MSESGPQAGARLALAGACLAIFFTAYERLEPLFSLGPISLTTSELAAGVFFVTVLVWAAGAGREFFARRALDLPVLLFIASCFLSSFFAVDRGSAMKFTLRLTYAALLYFGVSRLPWRRYRSHLVVGGAVTATLTTVALVGLLETYYLAINHPRLLEAFQQGVTTFGTFYNVRTTATLSFPTVFSFYLQLTLPVSLAFFFWWSRRQPSAARRNLVLVAAVSLTAIVMIDQIYSFTRSGFVSAPLSLLAGAAVAAWAGLGRRVWALFGVGALLMVALMGMFILTSNRVAVRLGLEEQEEVYTAGYTLASFPLELETDQVYQATIRAYNNSPFSWEQDGKDKVNLTYRWVTYPAREDVEVEYIVSDLPGKVGSGEEVDIDADFRTPRQEGRYVLIFDLVKSRVGWFSSSGTTPLIVPVEFGADGGRIFAIDDDPRSFITALPAQEAVPRRKLWEAAWLMWKDNPVIGVGSDQFRLRYTEYVPEVRHDERVRTHNIFLEALADHGVIGLVVMVYLLLAAAWTQLRLVRDGAADGVKRVFALALLVATMAYVMHGMLDWFLWQTGVAFMFFILLGLTSWLEYAGRLNGRGGAEEA